MQHFQFGDSTRPSYNDVVFICYACIQLGQWWHAHLALLWPGIKTRLQHVSISCGCQLRQVSLLWALLFPHTHFFKTMDTNTNCYRENDL